MTFRLSLSDIFLGAGAIWSLYAMFKKRGEKLTMANKDFGEWLDVVVETAKAYKVAMADGKLSMTDTLVIVPVLLKLPAAIEGSSVAFKDLSAADLKAAAVAVLDGAGLNDGKLHVYVEEAFNIVGHGLGIVESVKKIQAAV